VVAKRIHMSEAARACRHGLTRESRRGRRAGRALRGVVQERGRPRRLRESEPASWRAGSQRLQACATRVRAARERPWQVNRCARVRGTSAVRRSRNTSGSKTIVLVPSRQARRRPRGHQDRSRAVRWRWRDTRCTDTAARVRRGRGLALGMGDLFGIGVSAPRLAIYASLRSPLSERAGGFMGIEGQRRSLPAPTLRPRCAATSPRASIRSRNSQAAPTSCGSRPTRPTRPAARS